jgi:hypothetical protein
MSGLHRRQPRRAEQMSTLSIVVGCTLALAAALAMPAMMQATWVADGSQTTITDAGAARAVAADGQAGRGGSRIEAIAPALPGNQSGTGTTTPAGAPEPTTAAAIGERATDALTEAATTAGAEIPSSSDDDWTDPPDETSAPSGFAGASNTGYRNAPGYPGSLTGFSGRVESNKTYKFMEFAGGVGIPSGVTNVTFIGCRFTSNAVQDAMIAYSGDNVTFSYSSFEPSGSPGSARTVAYNAGYQYAIDQRGAGKLTIENSDFWGWGNAIQFGRSSKDKPVVIRDSWFHHARKDGGIDHTDAILENYGGPSYMVFDHNTIVSDGNTNGLALQGPSYSNVTVTRNYFSGFGYTVSLGVKAGGNHNVVFTGNTFGTDIKPDWGPLYGWSDGNGNLWRKNKWRIAPGGFSSASADDGQFWLPNGNRSSQDYSG